MLGPRFSLGFGSGCVEEPKKGCLYVVSKAILGTGDTGERFLGPLVIAESVSGSLASLIVLR